MVNIFLLGAYGQNNLGDDALLEVFLQELGTDNVIVNSAQPDQTRQRYGVTSVPTYGTWPHFPQLLALLQADLIVFGGGSLLKEIEGGWLARIAYFLRIFVVLLYGKLFDRRTIMLGVGIGPLQYPMYRWLSYQAAQLASLICVRDTDSRDLLMSIGVKNPVHVAADPVFLLTAATAVHAPPEPTRRTTIILIPRYSLAQQEHAMLADACNQLIATHDVDIQIMVFQTGYHPQFDDLRVAQAIAAAIQPTSAVRISIPATPKEAMENIAAADLVISTRLHGLIFACIQNVPIVAIDYEVKVHSFMRQINQLWASIALRELGVEHLVHTVEHALANKSSIVSHICEQLEPLRKQALQNSALLRTEVLNLTTENDDQELTRSRKLSRWWRSRWRSLLLSGITLVIAVMMWRVAHAEAPSVSHPAQQQIALIMPSLLDSEAEHASGAYLPRIGAVFTMQVIRGPNTIVDKPAHLGVRDWMIHLLLTFGSQLSAVPPTEQIAMSTEFYNYEDTVYHQLVITVAAADIADTSKYTIWLDGQPFDQAALQFETLDTSVR